MSAQLVLRTAIGPYGHTQPLKDGTVNSERLRLDQVEVEPITAAFRRQVRTMEFDVCEIALTTHALAHAYGKPLTALPIVLLRDFHHSALVCRAESDLTGPADLADRKVGVRAYSQTTGVWVRGILQTEYGLDPAAVTWVTFEDAHVQEYQDPPNVVRAPEGCDLQGMLLDGEIDAAIGLRSPDPALFRTVIPDAAQAAADWYHRTGVYPVNHVLSVRSELLAEHPWLARELMTEFTEAKDRYLQRLQADGPTSPADAALVRRMALVGADPILYGLEPNKRACNLLLEFAAQQQLTPRVYRVEELFDLSSVAA
jgi:4,5-dihydroxyphthalate decarboxylase